MEHCQRFRTSDAGIRRRRDVVRTGVTDEEIRRMCLGGSWHRLRRGTYTDRAGFTGLGAADRHRMLIAAVVDNLSGDAILSHQSAAVVYGAPVWDQLLPRVCVTRNRRNGGRIKPDLKVHCAPVDTVAEIAGLRLTTPARTIVDVARTVPFEAAVVAGDALVRTYGVGPGALAAELEAAKHRHGVHLARHVVRFLDPHSTSVGESRSRVMFHRFGIPVPLSHGEVFTSQGTSLGQVDFYFGDTGVVGEFDGRARYGRLVRSGDDPGQAVVLAKRREDALRGNGFQVVRWTWDDLAGGDVAARIRQALIYAGQRARPDGWIRGTDLPEPKPLVLHEL
ncbi:type IV toxin-antitoxin system AbiEi family antitoxin domain-containing protein [Nocardia aurantia]|uniref:Transcriptional regulator, AbiEi antitoxin, Type IV TA system n=1 Tax=Nocardia aurantia TaxID=2585199 RepID=A0A7K0DQT4_9NOCA|nr:type IV toxin-antitoxin system AbiEi family antitoxin domain-containing protein [Nocardia aurantia]MQY28136.1 hypothetical protein [Nocardia aurantia]